MEKAAAHCFRAGLHADCTKETGRADCVLRAAVVNRGTARGAARGKDLIESILRSIAGMTEMIDEG